MDNSDHDRIDQGLNSSTEDYTAMTIEFLRARLLSERSVSKSARQRADELAKKVTELEEQLRFVSLQRKKAEKATADVLAILETNGMSDVDETCYSSSDQDTPCESKVGNLCHKEEEDSVNSKVRRIESEELSGSDFDLKPVTGRSLSWRGRKDSPRSTEKYKDSSSRRRSSFASAGSSPKNRPGKSCRKVRGKESRSAFKDNSFETDSRENGIADSDISPRTSERVSEVEEEKAVSKGPASGYIENGHNSSSNGDTYTDCRSDRDMEKALEHQAQLIGQYEAMEKAQRDWEEKFRENNNSMQDSGDPGNHSDITEERVEISVQASHANEVIIPQMQDTKTDVGDLHGTGTSGIQSPSHDPGYLKEQRDSSIPASESPNQDFAFPTRGNQIGNGRHPQSHSLDPHPYSESSHNSPGSQSAAIFPSNTARDFNKGKASENQNEQYALVQHKAPNELDGVLENLRQARQSLQLKINTLPVAEAKSVGESIEASMAATLPGAAGLFRLPTDFSVEANNRARFFNPSARLSLGNYYPDTGVPVATGNRFLTSSYSESRSSFPIEDRLIASPYVESGSRFPSQKPYFDPYLDTGLPSSSRYTYPNYPVNTSYPDLMPRVPSRETLSTFVPRRTFGMPPADHFPFPYEDARPNMDR